MSEQLPRTAPLATVYFVPDANYYGAPTFQYAAVDNTGRHDTTPATATINVVNQAPFIVAPANLQYDPASGDTTAFNRIMFRCGYNGRCDRPSDSGWRRWNAECNQFGWRCRLGHRH
jgi:hypothetical protein